MKGGHLFFTDHHLFKKDDGLFIKDDAKENIENKKRSDFFAPLELLFYDSHFINQVTAITQLVDNEENVADIYCDTTLEVVVEVDVTTQ